MALVGASGSGKSTVFYLLERFYDVNDGQVSLMVIIYVFLGIEYLLDRYKDYKYRMAIVLTILNIAIAWSAFCWQSLENVKSWKAIMY